MSYSANLKNVMSMETGQRNAGNLSTADQEMDTSKLGPSPQDLAAQLKSSLLAEIGLTESDGPPLPSFRYMSILHVVVRTETPDRTVILYHYNCIIEVKLSYLNVSDYY